MLHSSVILVQRIERGPYKCIGSEKLGFHSVIG
jgi:hypothetical protein